MKRVLITGGAGYIGSVLTPFLNNLGYHTTVVDNFMYNQTSLANMAQKDNFELIFGDVRDETLMKPLLKKADVVIPLAAIVGAPACDKDPIAASSINKDSVEMLLRNIGQEQQILMPTTNSAYGSGDKDNYCDENSPLNPLSLYAKDKVEIEKKLMQHPKATSFRLATVFGVSPRMRLDLLVNNFCYRALTDGFVVIFEGHFKRNYIHLVDVCNAFALALNEPNKFNGEIFNVGLSSANVSKLDLCEQIKKVLPNFVYLEAPLGKDPDQRNYIVSNKKIESLGFSPKNSLESGIKELVKFMRMFTHKLHSNI